jgi:adenylosuccinate synthase
VDAVALTQLDTAAAHEDALKICRGYRIGTQLITTLKPGPHRDLAHQEMLTRTLLTARPVYRPDERLTAEDWPGAVSEILRAPVVIRSHGPGIPDKTAAEHAAAATARPRAAVSR